MERPPALGHRKYKQIKGNELNNEILRLLFLAGPFLVRTESSPERVRAMLEGLPLPSGKHRESLLSVREGLAQTVGQGAKTKAAEKEPIN